MPALTLVLDEDDDVLIREGEAQVQPFQDDLASAHSRIVVLAKGLAAAKRKYRNTIRFGVWLASSPYGRLGDTARAALIKLGENEAEAEPIISSTSSASPERIWKEVKAARETSEPRNSEQPAGNPFIEKVKAKIRKIPPESLSDDIAQVARGVSDDAHEVVLELRRAIARMNDLVNTLTAYGEPGEENVDPPRHLN